MSTEAMKLALEALEMWCPMTATYLNTRDKAITALQEALAQPQPEPVAWRVKWPAIGGGYKWLMVDKPLMEKEGFVNEALYTSPPAQRKPLTDEELYKVFPAIATYTEANKTLYRSIARAIEAAHGIKENRNETI